MDTGQRTVNGGSGHGKVNQHQEVSGSVRKWATDTSPFLRNSIRAAVEAEAKPGRKTVATCSCSLMNSHSGLANIPRMSLKLSRINAKYLTDPV